MPVQTRSQAKQKAVRSPSDAQALKFPRSDPPLPFNQGLDDCTEVLTPKSLNAKLETAGRDVKVATATKDPVSHPLVEETSAMSLEDSPDPQNSVGFTIPAINPCTTAAVEPLQLPGPGKKPVVPPEEKLLKPLPDQPVECTKLPDGPEPVVVEVEYPTRSELQPIQTTSDTTMSTLIENAIASLDSREWMEVCKSLTIIRQIAVHHSSDFLTITSGAVLSTAVPKVIQSIRNLRSALSKTAILTLRDLYISFPEEMLPLTDIGNGVVQPLGSALAQLLLKAASNDKKFVIEEAQRTLTTMATVLDPVAFLSLVLPYTTEHKNPKVRGKAAAVAAECMVRVQPMDVYSFGMDKLIVIASKLMNDNSPDARESAKKIVTMIQASFDDPAVAATVNVEAPHASSDHSAQDQEEPAKEMTRWELYCHSLLGSSKAVPFVRAFN